MELKDIVTLALAAFGAALSAYNFYLSRKDKSWRLETILIVGHANLNPKPELVIEIRNIGEKLVSVIDAGVILPNKDIITFARQNLNKEQLLPYDLPDGKNVLLRFNLRQIAEVIETEGYLGKTKLKAYASNGIGKQYLSKSIIFDTKEYTGGIAP